jgi:hypothetical protein
MNTRLRSTCWQCGYSLQHLAWTRTRGACPECGRRNIELGRQFRGLVRAKHAFWITFFPSVCCLGVAVVGLVLYVVTSPSTRAEPDPQTLAGWDRADNFFMVAYAALGVSLLSAMFVPGVRRPACWLAPRGLRKAACAWSLAGSPFAPPSTSL